MNISNRGLSYSYYCEEKNETNKLELAKKILLEPAELGLNKIETILSNTLSRTINYVDLYFQEIQYESWALEDNIIKHANFNGSHGVGVRAISGEKTGFAYSNNINLKSLKEVSKAVRGITRSAVFKKHSGIKEVVGHHLYHPMNPLNTLTEDKKVSLLHQINALARAKDSRVTQVTASLSGSYEVILIIASDGTLAADIRPLVYLNVGVILEDKNKREQGGAGGGGRVGYDCFLNNSHWEEYVDKAIRKASINLEASSVPAGLMPVILGSGWSGVLLHEAIGHGLEGDFNRKGTSAFTGKIGQRVASSVCSVVDNGTIPGRRGSLNIDDEGTPTQCTMLIEKGILKGYMLDKLNARLLKSKSTGNARRESFETLPFPRMTNTYMLPGKYAPEEIIASVSKGLYVSDIGGGQVDITSGKFVFTTSEAYMIEKGKITYPVKHATLIGHGPDILKKVSMVGNNMELDSGVGMCGKEGQSVPVGVGQPMLKIDELTVGGILVDEKE